MEQLSPLEILSADKKVEQLSEEELHCVLKQLTDHNLPEREKCPLVRRLNAEDTAKNSDNSYPSTVASERTSASTPTSSSCSFASSSTTTSASAVKFQSESDRNCHTDDHHHHEGMTTMCPGTTGSNSSSNSNSHVNNNHHHQQNNSHYSHYHSHSQQQQQVNACNSQNSSSRLEKVGGALNNSYAQPQPNSSSSSSSFMPQYYQSRTPANSTSSFSSTNHCDDSQQNNNQHQQQQSRAKSGISRGVPRTCSADTQTAFNKILRKANRANSFTMPSSTQHISGDKCNNKSFSTSSSPSSNANMSVSSKGDTFRSPKNSPSYASLKNVHPLNGEVSFSGGEGAAAAVAAAGRSARQGTGESQQQHRKQQQQSFEVSAASAPGLTRSSPPSNLVVLSNSSHSQCDITPSLSTTSTSSSLTSGRTSAARPPFTAYNISTTSAPSREDHLIASPSAQGREAGAKIFSSLSNSNSNSSFAPGGDNPLSQLSNFVNKLEPRAEGIKSQMLKTGEEVAAEQKTHQRISYKGLAPRSAHCCLRKHRSLSLTEEDEEESCDKSASSLCFGEEMNLQSQGQLMEYHSSSQSKSPSRSQSEQMRYGDSIRPLKEHVDKCLDMSLFTSNSGNNSYSNTLEENHLNNYTGKHDLLMFLLCCSIFTNTNFTKLVKLFLQSKTAAIAVVLVASQCHN